MRVVINRHRHLLVSLLFVLLPFHLFPDGTTTAFYSTVFSAHLEDVDQLISIVIKLKAQNSALPDWSDNQSEN